MGHDRAQSLSSTVSRDCRQSPSDDTRERCASLDHTCSSPDGGRPRERSAVDILRTGSPWRTISVRRRSTRLPRPERICRRRPSTVIPRGSFPPTGRLIHPRVTGSELRARPHDHRRCGVGQGLWWHTHSPGSGDHHVPSASASGSWGQGRRSLFGSRLTDSCGQRGSGSNTLMSPVLPPDLRLMQWFGGTPASNGPHPHTASFSSNG